MKINVANLKKMLADVEPFSFNVPTKSIFPECSGEENDYSFWENGRVIIEGVCRNNGQLMEISGTVTAVISSSCGRCLEEASVTINVPFCQEYREADAGYSYHSDEAEADSDLENYSGNEIDLGPAVRETLLLAQPLSQVCREDCLGLCPDCGANLNVADCGCAAKKTDFRLAVLKNLFKETNQ